MTKADASALVGILISYYPGVRFDETNAAAYEGALAQYDAKEAQEAVMELVNSSTRLPVPAEIRAEIMRLRKRSHERTSVPQLPPAGIGPSKQEWGVCLTRMLEEQARFERMTKAWCEKNGKPYSGDPGAQFVELAAAGARGDDVRDRFRREVIGAEEEQEELERRHP